MPRNWRRIARHYLSSLGSFLFYVPYGVYKGVKTAYHFAKKRYEESGYNLTGLLAHVFLFPLYSFYRFLLGSFELVANKTVPWYK